MTHEATPNGEADAGPEHDDSLPDADEVRVYADPADSDGPEFLFEDAPPLPQWSGPTRNEV